jgi:hypothetical protein
MARRYALRDDQWERIKGLLPGRAFPLLSHCRRTIGCSWKLCCTDIGQEFPGVNRNGLVTCFLVHARTALMVKQWGVGCMFDRELPRMPTRNTPGIGSTIGSSYWTQQRGIEYQDSCDRVNVRSQSVGVSSHPRIGL